MNKNAIYSGRPSKKIILFELIKMLIFFVIILIATNILDKHFNIYSFIPALKLALVGLLALLCAFKVLSKTILVYSRKYILSKEVLTLQTGILNIRVDNLELYRVKDISIHKSLIYRFFGLADIVLYTADVSNPTIKLLAIKDYEKLFDNLRENIESTRSTSILETI